MGFVNHSNSLSFLLKQKTLIVLSLFLCSLVMGCGPNPFGSGATTISTTYGPNPSVPVVPSATNIAPITGSVQSGLTTQNARASLSVGAATSKMKLTTTNGATAYLSVQGQIISK